VIPYLTLTHQWRNGEITATKAMQILTLKRNTFYKFVKEQEEINKENT